MQKYNYLGKPLGITNKIVRDNKYLDKNGNIRWDKFVKSNDPRGFKEGDIDTVMLPKGKRLVRYGSSNGTFTTDKGTDYDMLSLPYIQESMEYHEYVVSENDGIECIVEKGIVAEGFDSKGGAVQYHHLKSINNLLKEGVLKEDMSWLKEM